MLGGWGLGVGWNESGVLKDADAVFINVSFDISGLADMVAVFE